jgi:hypothetical protein
VVGAIRNKGDRLAVRRPAGEYRSSRAAIEELLRLFRPSIGAIRSSISDKRYRSYRRHRRIIAFGNEFRRSAGSGHGPYLNLWLNRPAGFGGVSAPRFDP